jgi:hypothetical protein
MLYREIIAVCSQIPTKHINTYSSTDVTPVAHQCISAFTFFLRSAPASWLLLLPLVFTPLQHVSGVTTGQNVTSPHNPHSPHSPHSQHSSAYSYYEDHSSELGTGSSLYYVPVNSYDGQEGKAVWCSCVVNSR